MRYEFEYATIEECLEALVERLDAATAAGDDAVFTHAVSALVGVYVLAAGGAPAPDPERYPQLRRRVVAALARNRPRLRGYLARTLTAALAVPEYAEAAFRRSVLQALRDDYPELAGELPDGDLAGIDRELRASAAAVPPLPAGTVPPGLPGTHWWWSAPHGDPDRHRYDVEEDLIEP